MKRGRRVLLTLPVVLGLGVSLIVTPAQASRFGPSGPPRYPSFPFDERFPESGEPPAFLTCAEAAPAEATADAGIAALCAGTAPALRPFMYVWRVPPAQYAVGPDSFIAFYSFRNAIQSTPLDMPAPAGYGTRDFEIDYVAHAAKAGQLGNTPDGNRIAALASRLDAQKDAKGYFFDFERPSFTQDVDVVSADFKTPDNTVLDLNLKPLDLDGDGNENDGYPIKHDAEFSTFFPDLYNQNPSLPKPIFFPGFDNSSVDGSANLGPMAFTVANGTQFMNMQVDRAGNYYVARRDMQWDWIDTFRGKNLATNEIFEHDTFFNIQPYPVSDAYGWCGALPPEDPNSRQSMAGQLIKDIAFDVYALDMSPADGAPPFTTEVVPSFVMRSFGTYVVDVTMANFGGIRQRFSSKSKGVHQRPVDVDLDGNGTIDKLAGSVVEPGDADYAQWLNRVSPFAAGVVPTGAWVINEGNPTTMQVVPPGTPGAVWHQNKFAGAAFIVRGDMERRVNYIQVESAFAGDQTTVSNGKQVYLDLVNATATNPKTGLPWKRADWTDWEAYDYVNNTGSDEVLPSAY